MRGIRLACTVFLFWPVHGAEFAPLETGTRYLLGSESGLLQQFRVVLSEEFPTVRRIRLESRGISGDAVLILRSSDSGIALEGIEANGRTKREFTPVLLFVPDPAAGWKSSGDLVKSRYRARTAILNTPAGQFSDVDEYEVEIAGLPASVWQVKQGFGVVGYKAAGAAAGLLAYEFTPRAAPPPREPAPCPVVGVDANPVAFGGDFSAEGLRAQAAQMRDAGAGLFNASASWPELEPERGVYDFSGVRRQMAWVEELGLDAVFTLKTVDTTVRRTPQDLAASAWDAPEMLSRLVALLEALSGEFGSRVKWVNLGNEVNVYFSGKPEELDAFTRFYRAGAERLEQLKPEVQTGLVFAYDVLRLDDEGFSKLVEPLRQVSFTYYGAQSSLVQNRTVLVQRDAGEAALDFADMRALAGGRQVLLTEAGHSSSPFIGSSEAKQAEFYAAAKEQVRLGAGWLAGVNFFLLSDIHPAVVRQFSQYYFGGQSSPFVAWLGSLGTRDIFGRAKPANGVLLEALADSRRPDTCEAVGLPVRAPAQ